MKAISPMTFKKNNYLSCVIVNQLLWYKLNEFGNWLSHFWLENSHPWLIVSEKSSFLFILFYIVFLIEFDFGWKSPP